jgi:prepilin-type N-terminal cleavage/methylation domain-containing protein
MARNQLKKIYQHGFTLVEILVAVTLSVILLAAASGLFFATLRSDSKKNYVSDLKDTGDYAMSQIEFLLRNAVALERLEPTAPYCAPGMNQILFRSIDNGVTILFEEEGRIASESVNLGVAGAVDTKYLTGDQLTVSNLSFDCKQSSPNIGTYIKIGFTLTYASTSSMFFGDGGSENFSTTINVRSY